MANKQQRFIVVAYPIDGYVGPVMNSIQRRQERRGPREVSGQCGPIKHVSIVLNTIDTTRCRCNLPEVFHVSRGLERVIPVAYLLHLFKRQRILGFQRASGAEGV